MAMCGPQTGPRHLMKPRMGGIRWRGPCWLDLLHSGEAQELWRGDGRRVGARAPPARPACFACSVAAGERKGPLGTLPRVCWGQDEVSGSHRGPGGHMPRLRRLVQLTAARGSGASQGAGRPGAVGPPEHSRAGGADRGLALPTRRGAGKARNEAA